MTFQCPNGHTPETFIVFVPEDLDSDRIGFQVKPDGRSTNLWADGVVGLNTAQRFFAEEEESAQCPECLVEAPWVHDEEGRS